MPIDREAAYEEVRDNLVALVRELSEEDLHTNVPATPDWDVKDVVGHVTGEAGIVSTGEFPVAVNLFEAWRDEEEARRREEMNAIEVGRRRELPLEDVLDEWAGHAATLAPMLRGEEQFPLPLPFQDDILVTDVALHDQDVRNTLGRPGHRETTAVQLGISFYVAAIGTRLDALGLPALRLVYGDRDRVVGDGEPAAVLRTDRYELYRTMASRRTKDQILAMEWEGDPSPFVDVIATFGERDVPIAE